MSPLHILALDTTTREGSIAVARDRTLLYECAGDAARTHGESLWVEASRGGLRGYGEGCPRPYVTGETRESVRAWLGDRAAQIAAECDSLDDLRAWTVTHEDVFAEFRRWCLLRQQQSRRTSARKFFYVFTCEY